MPDREAQKNSHVETERKHLLRALPSVEKVLSLPETALLRQEYSRRLVVTAIREVLERLRHLIVNPETELPLVHISVSHIVSALKDTLENMRRPNFRRLVNATGIIVHTNLGRSLLPRVAVDQMADVALNYSNLEFDLSTGRRGSRYHHVQDVLRELTGAESALVVNNNAAAVLLVLDTLAKGKEVIVSRGQLVEIGGSFRIPDIMAGTGACLVEVGTTNRTHLADYERAISPNTAFLMKVHTSNFHILGFTSEVSLTDLVALGKKYGIPVVEDLGSGSLVDLSQFGFVKEPTVQETLRAGADIVTFSGDKLLGGPQAGIILGREELISQVRNNPFNRALRIDKLTLAALEATLRLYFEDNCVKKIPTLNFLTAPIEEINKKALRLNRSFKRMAGDCFAFRIINVESQVGGGALPLQKLPSRALAVEPRDISVVKLESELRNLRVPIIGRIDQNRFIMDMRTVWDDDIPKIVEAFKIVFGM